MARSQLCPENLVTRYQTGICTERDLQTRFSKALISKTYAPSAHQLR